MQLSVGSRWNHSDGKIFVVESVDHNGTETWVAYRCEGTNMHYRCLAEAFTYRFKELTQ